MLFPLVSKFYLKMYFLIEELNNSSEDFLSLFIFQILNFQCTFMRFQGFFTMFMHKPVTNFPMYTVP